MKKLLLLFCFALIMGQSFAQVYELTNDYPMSGPFSRFNGEVNAMSLDSNGKLIVGGDFTDYNGNTRNNLARLNADGTVDVGFDPGVSLTSSVYDITVHSDNTITVATVGGVQRFDNTGAEITGPTFDPDVIDYIVKVVAAESTGLGVIIAGSFTDIGGTTANGIARLNADGTIDATFATNVGIGFNVTGTLGSKEVTSIEITSSGKILLGGDFTSFNGTTRNYIVLLNSDGTLDTAFDPGSWFEKYRVESVAMQADGKILVGSYSTVEGAARINRFTTAGVLETFGNVFTNGIASFGIYDIISVNNDKAILGTFGYGGLSIIEFGVKISSVVAGKGVYVGDVNSMVLNTDGSLILGGSFSDYNGITSNNIAKVAICGVSIDTQPLDATACETGNTAFTVAASGTGTLTYQWQLNTDAFGTGLYVDIVDDATYGGATTTALAITSASIGMSNYYYRCIITDDNCSSTTDVKQLTVNANDQAFTVDPVDVAVCDGFNANFSVTVTGTIGGYQWQEDPGTGNFADLVEGSPYANVTSTSLNVTATINMDGYKYRLISNLCAPAGLISASATLTVKEVPVVSEQPSDVTLCVSGDAAFSVTATGSALSYQWQYSINNGVSYQDLANNASYSGVGTASLNLSNVDENLPELVVNNANQSSVYFRCVVTSNGCSSNSDNALLYIHKTPIINTQPVNYIQCVNAGDTRSTNFFPFLEFEGTGMFFQWEYDDGNGFVTISDNTVYSGTSSRVLNLTNASSAFNGSYRLAVGACSPTIYTDPVLFTLDERPALTILSETLPKICAGASIDMEIVSSNSQVIYQWQRQPQNGSFVDISDNGTYSGTNTSLLSISGASLNDHFARFRIVTTNGACDVNSSSIRLEVYDQPKLTNSNPTSALTVCDGGATTLRVNASNQNGILSGIMTYQWQVDAFDLGFTDISDDDNYTGTSAKTLSINIAPLSFNGSKYRCVIRGCTTENASESVTLTVLQLPLVTSSPQSQTVCHGEQVTFTAEATGSDITYSWWRDAGDGTFGQVRAPNANADYTFVANRDFNSYKYKCIAQAGNCTTTSESFEATLTVRETQITAVSTQSLGMCAGQTEAFSVTMSNTDGLTFQWSDANGALSDDDVYSGVTTSILTVTAPATAINNYSVAISGDCGNQSASYQLLVYGLETPVIEANFGDPANPQIFVNSSFTLGIDNFEWFLNGSTYQSTGGTASVGINQEGSYTVVANKNGCDHPESNAIVIVITGFENNLTKNAVSIYPNPVNNKLTLEMSKDFDTSKGSKIILTNTSGKQVYTKRHNNLYNRKVDIDMTGFESGIYIVSVINGDNIVQYKITKQ